MQVKRFGSLTINTQLCANLQQSSQRNQTVCAVRLVGCCKQSSCRAPKRLAAVAAALHGREA